MGTLLWLFICFLCFLAGIVLGWWVRNHFGCWFDWHDNPHVSREATGAVDWSETQHKIDNEIRARLKALN